MMQDYLTEIKFAVEVLLRSRARKEYNDFVNLALFCGNSAPKTIRSKPLDEQQRRVLPVDSAGSKIDDNYIEYYLEDMLFEEIDLDDVLVSILVTIALAAIVIHENNPLPSKESVTMIRNVFGTALSPVRMRTLRPVAG